jgi:hypothetical protein
MGSQRIMADKQPTELDWERYHAMERVYEAAKAAYFSRTPSGISTHSDDGELAEAIRAMRLLDSLREGSDAR